MGVKEELDSEPPRRETIRSSDLNNMGSPRGTLARDPQFPIVDFVKASQ